VLATITSWEICLSLRYFIFSISLSCRPR
jgi:hypothetical protein